MLRVRPAFLILVATVAACSDVTRPSPATPVKQFDNGDSAYPGLTGAEGDSALRAIAAHLAYMERPRLMNALLLADRAQAERIASRAAAVASRVATGPALFDEGETIEYPVNSTERPDAVMFSYKTTAALNGTSATVHGRSTFEGTHTTISMTYSTRFKPGGVGVTAMSLGSHKLKNTPFWTKALSPPTLLDAIAELPNGDRTFVHPSIPLRQVCGATIEAQGNAWAEYDLNPLNGTVEVRGVNVVIPGITQWGDTPPLPDAEASVDSTATCVPPGGYIYVDPEDGVEMVGPGELVVHIPNGEDSRPVTLRSAEASTDPITTRAWRDGDGNPFGGNGNSATPDIPLGPSTYTVKVTNSAGLSNTFTISVLGKRGMEECEEPLQIAPATGRGSNGATASRVAGPAATRDETPGCEEGDPDSYVECAVTFTGWYFWDTGEFLITDVDIECYVVEGQAGAALEGGPSAMSAARRSITVFGTSALPGGVPTLVRRRAKGNNEVIVAIDTTKASTDEVGAALRLASAIDGVAGLRTGDAAKQDLEMRPLAGQVGRAVKRASRQQATDVLGRLRSSSAHNVVGFGFGKVVTVDIVPRRVKGKH
jgi:hypothetical protein